MRNPRLVALIAGTMLALAVATTAESRRLDVTDTTPTAAVSVAERPATAANAAVPPLDNPSPAALWVCAANRQGVGGEEATVYRSRVLTMGVSGGLGWLSASCFTYVEDRYCNYANRGYTNGFTVHTAGPHCVIVD